MLGADAVEYMVQRQRRGAIGGPLRSEMRSIRVGAGGNYILSGTDIPTIQLGADEPSGKDKAFGFLGMVAVALVIGAIFVGSH